MVHLHQTGALPKGRALIPGCGSVSCFNSCFVIKSSQSCDAVENLRDMSGHALLIASEFISFFWIVSFVSSPKFIMRLHFGSTFIIDYIKSTIISKWEIFLHETVTISPIVAQNPIGLTSPLKVLSDPVFPVFPFFQQATSFVFGTPTRNSIWISTHMKVDIHTLEWNR